MGGFFIGPNMTEGTDTPTVTLDADAPAKVETSTQEQTTPENETAKLDESAKLEGAESTEGDAEESTTSEKPKRVSGYDRMKRKNQYLQSEILRLQEQASKPAADDGDKAPREEDYNGDWGKFIAASAAYEAAKAVKDTLTADKKAANESKMAELRTEVLSDFEERAEAFKAKATDFDQVIGKFIEGGGQLNPVVRELVTESDVGPELAYHLAKHPAVANKVNSLPPLQAAKEIARLEDSLSRPSNRATKAPPPLKTPTGGASAPVDLATLAKSEDASDYIRMRQQQSK